MNMDPNTTVPTQPNQVVSDQDLAMAELALEDEMAQTQAALAQADMVDQMLQNDAAEDVADQPGA